MSCKEITGFRVQTGRTNLRSPESGIHRVVVVLKYVGLCLSLRIYRIRYRTCKDEKGLSSASCNGMKR